MLLASVAGAAYAQPVRTISPEGTAEALQRWEERLERTEGLIAAGQFGRAYSSATRLLDEMTELLISGSSVGSLLGTATLLRAVAAYEMGRSAEALWHWHVAQQLFPEIPEAKLAEYGRAGEFLAANPYEEAHSAKAVADLLHCGESREDCRNLRPPRRLEAPYPSFPTAQRGQDQVVSVVVKAIIDKQGLPHSPMIEKAQGELTLVARSLDALRNWTFRPAMLNGEPVAAYYSLTVNFAPQSRGWEKRWEKRWSKGGPS